MFSCYLKIWNSMCHKQIHVNTACNRLLCYYFNGLWLICNTKISLYGKVCKNKQIYMFVNFYLGNWTTQISFLLGLQWNRRFRNDQIIPSNLLHFRKCVFISTLLGVTALVHFIEQLRYQCFMPKYG